MWRAISQEMISSIQKSLKIPATRSAQATTRITAQMQNAARPKRGNCAGGMRSVMAPERSGIARDCHVKHTRVKSAAPAKKLPDNAAARKCVRRSFVRQDAELKRANW